MRLVWICTAALLALSPAIAQPARSLGPPQSGGSVVFGDPVAVALPVLGPAAVAPEAVVARAVMSADERHFRTLASVRIPEPFATTLPRGTIFAERMGDSGQLERCAYHGDHEPFAPYRDGEGHIYPGVCLEARASDGSYHALRLRPYRPEWPQRRLAISPLQLEPAPPGHDSPSAHFIVRRLRIAEVAADRAQLTLEDAAFLLTPDAPTIGKAMAAATFRAKGTLALPLVEGATATIAGVTLQLHRDGAGWTIESRGGFGAFAYLTRGGAGIATTSPTP